MYRKVLLWLCLLLALVGTVMAATKESATKESATKESAAKESAAKESAAKESAAKKSAAKESAAKESAAKELSGMSIVGNDEAPKALYIVPWKSSEIGVETSLDMMLNAGDMPVDRVVFMRQLDFYELSTKK